MRDSGEGGVRTGDGGARAGQGSLVTGPPVRAINKRKSYVLDDGSLERRGGRGEFVLIAVDDGSSSMEHRGGGRDARTWSDIPWDILFIVLRRLTILDFLRCGAVCTSWRRATLQRQCRPRLEHPWVISFSGHAGSSGVVCPPETRLHQFPSLPWKMIGSSDYIGSSNGWLGLQRMESVHIVHALSGEVLRLPNLTTIPGVKVVYGKGGRRWLAFPYCGLRLRSPLKGKGSPFIHSIFIVQGGDRDQLIVFAVCYDMWRLLFARPSDVSWSLVDIPTPVGNDGDNIVVGIAGHRGSVYAVDMRGRVAAWDYCCSSRGEADAGALASGPRFTRIVASTGPLHSNLALMQRHLVVEANGDLLQVELLVYDRDLTSSKFGGALVYRLKQPGDGEGQGRAGCWRPVSHDLGHGGTAVVVGRGFSAAFSCSEFPWLQKNCIYTTGGVYNLWTQKMLEFPHSWRHGHWLDVPSLPISPGMEPLQT